VFFVLFLLLCGVLLCVVCVCVVLCIVLYCANTGRCTREERIEGLCNEKVGVIQKLIFDRGDIFSSRLHRGRVFVLSPDLGCLISV